MAVYTLDAGNLTQWAFNSDACRSKGATLNPVTNETVYTELATGDWKVTIENTSGDLWESNEVTVVYYGEAIMSDVSIEDDYDTPITYTGTNVTAGVKLAKTTDLAILNVTFNKNYAGTLYLIDSKIEKGYAGHADNKILLNGANNLGIKDKLTAVKTKAQLTNKNATVNGGIYWEDATGAMHVKMPVALKTGETVTRGSSYYLVWDQLDTDADDFKEASSKKEDLNTSDDMEVPYVVAPDSIAVSSFSQNSDTVKVDALDESGEKLAWYTIKDGAAVTLTDLGLDSAKIFKVDTNEKSSTDSSEAANTQAVKGGTFTLTTLATIPNAYVYVKLATKAGVFAKDSITLESDLSETARDALTSMSLEEDSTTPTSAVVKFKGLSTKAPGTVYIMQGNNSTTEKVTGATNDGKAEFAKIAGHGLDAAIASAAVEGGAASVTIPGVFEADDMVAGAGTYGSDMGNNAFVAVFVPDDEELWKRANSIAKNANGNDVGFTLAPSITTIDKSGLTAELTVVSATVPEITIAGIQAMDQFGNKWKGTAQATNAASVSKNNSTVTNTEDATVKGTTTTTKAVADVDPNGEISIVVVNKDAAAWDKGDGVTVKVPGLKNLEIKLTAKDLLTFANTYISVGTDAGDATTRVAVNATLDAKGGSAGDLKLSNAFSIS